MSEKQIRSLVVLNSKDKELLVSKNVPIQITYTSVNKIIPESKANIPTANTSNSKKKPLVPIIIAIILLAAAAGIVLAVLLPQMNKNSESSSSVNSEGYAAVGSPSSELSVDYTIIPEQIIFGQTIKVNMSASGGSGNYQYHVSYKKKTEKNWSVKQDYSTNTTAEIKPARPVDYDILVKVKDSNGTVKELQKEFTVLDTLKISYTLSAHNVTPNDQITVTMSSEGGTGTHTYAVYYILKSQYEANNDIDWNCSQHFKENNVVTLPKLPEGEYYFCAKVMDENGIVRKTEYDTIISKNG